MSLIKLFLKTIKKEKAVIILFLCSLICINLYYYLLADKGFQAYPVLLCLFFLIIYLGIKMNVYNALYKYLQESKKSPGYKRAESTQYEEVFQYINEIHENYLKEIEVIKLKKEEKENLIVEWIHNMKTSVSVISLAASSLENSEAAEDIRLENNLLEKNLQGALNIFRLDDFSKDYLIEKINLKDLVKETVNSEKREFIYNKVYPKVNIDENINVLTDRKWALYILKQILSNSIKYSKQEDKIEFFNEGKALHIKDYGMGIKKSELSRVFEAFYTGSNGRKTSKSTGIGLYMCKKICENINISIELKSEENLGTEVILEFKTLQEM